MRQAELLVLGCGSATPTTTTHPTAQLLTLGQRLILVDCGEGTQIELRRHKARFSKISLICISHLHGDHYFGLIGLLSSFHLLDRQLPLHVFGPPELEEILNLQLKHSRTELRFPLHFHPTQAGTPQKIWDDERLEVHSFPLLHSAPTTGFKFVQKPGPRHLNAELCNQLGIPGPERRLIKDGNGFTHKNGREFTHEELTLPGHPSLSYAFCSDTGFHPPVADHVKGVDLLYHEATFAEAEEDLALRTMHSTAAQAGRIARMAEVKQLLIGHFSVRYGDRNLLLEQSRAEFPATLLAEEGVTYTIHENIEAGH